MIKLKAKISTILVMSLSISLSKLQTVPTAKLHTNFESWILVDLFDSKGLEKMLKLDQVIDV